MSYGQTICEPLVVTIPKCVDSMVLETSADSEPVRVRIAKYNNNVRYYNVLSDSNGIVTIPLEEEFITPFSGNYFITAVNDLNEPIYLISNLGMHLMMRLSMENSNLQTGGAFTVDQSIVYVCCQHLTRCNCT